MSFKDPNHKSWAGVVFVNPAQVAWFSNFLGMLNQNAKTMQPNVKIISKIRDISVASLTEGSDDSYTMPVFDYRDFKEIWNTEETKLDKSIMDYNPQDITGSENAWLIAQAVNEDWMSRIYQSGGVFRASHMFTSLMSSENTNPTGTKYTFVKDVIVKTITDTVRPYREHIADADCLAPFRGKFLETFDPNDLAGFKTGLSIVEFQQFLSNLVTKYPEECAKKKWYKENEIEDMKLALSSGLKFIMDDMVDCIATQQLFVKDLIFFPFTLKMVFDIEVIPTKPMNGEVLDTVEYFDRLCAQVLEHTRNQGFTEKNDPYCKFTVRIAKDLHSIAATPTKDLSDVEISE